ncbi:MAG: hypothetical protein H7Z14_04775 [Anaerolineae bacterium]|nr:hypothetical protein [Phycisphaerae bacterium]
MVAQAIRTRLSRINAMLPSSPAAIGCCWIVAIIAYNDREWNVTVQVTDATFLLHRNAPAHVDGDLG